MLILMLTLMLMLMLMLMLVARIPQAHGARRVHGALLGLSFMRLSCPPVSHLSGA